MSKKSSSSRIRASFSADSTSASGVGAPYRSSRSLSSEPAFTPIRIGTPRHLASRAITRTLSWYLMLPGLIRSPWIPASSAAIAYFHWKWMSATTGTVDFAAIASSAFASSQCGTATRTMSTPVATSDAICCSVALMSEVFVVVIDCTETGASPPMATLPTCSCRLVRRVFIGNSLSAAHHLEGDRPRLGLIELEGHQPLPGPERRLPADHRDRMGRRREQHRLHVRVTVRALVGLEVLGPDLEVVVAEIGVVVRDEVGEMPAEVVERAVLPFVDQQGAGRVGAERHHHAVGDAGVLDRAAEVVGEVEVGEALVRCHGDR